MNETNKIEYKLEFTSDTDIEKEVNFIKTLDLYNSEGKFNYFANLLSDNSNVSFKVAKYSSIDRVDLIENNEYGYCSIIKATNNIISKFEVEN